MDRLTWGSADVRIGLAIASFMIYLHTLSPLASAQKSVRASNSHLIWIKCYVRRISPAQLRCGLDRCGSSTALLWWLEWHDLAVHRQSSGGLVSIYHTYNHLFVITQIGQTFLAGQFGINSIRIAPIVFNVSSIKFYLFVWMHIGICT